MARRRKGRHTKYSRLVGYIHKKDALKDASYERSKGRSVRIRKERKMMFGRRRTVYGLYTKD